MCNLQQGLDTHRVTSAVASYMQDWRDGVQKDQIVYLRRLPMRLHERFHDDVRRQIANNSWRTRKSKVA